MREKFPRKKKRERLSADHVNALGGVVERFAGFVPGGSLKGHHRGSSVSIAGPVPWSQFVVEVSDLQINAGDAVDSGLYLVQIRWYSRVDSSWHTDEKEWELDANGIPNTVLRVGDRLTAFWCEQRGMFLPVTSTGVMVVDCVNDGGVAGNETTNCTFTYTVSNLSGTVLGTLVTPERPRYLVCKYLPGDGLGLATYVSGTLRLLVAFREIEDTTTCDEESSESSSSISVSESSVSSLSSAHSSASSASSLSSLSSPSASSESSASWESHSSLSSGSSQSESSVSSLSSLSSQSASSVSSISSPSSPSSVSSSSTSSPSSSISSFSSPLSSASSWSVSSSSAGSSSSMSSKLGM